MAAIEVQGLSQFRRDLRQLENGQRWVKELAGENRGIAHEAAGWVRSEAQAMGGPQRHFASAIRGYGSTAGASIRVARPEANAAFWGAKKRTGWNAGNDTPNLPPWVGNTWEAAGFGGPYAINTVLRQREDWIVERFDAAVARVATAASSYFTTTF